ncbi:hypothetical protein [Streptococcus dentiloxodontae]
MKVEYWEQIADKWCLITDGLDALLVSTETDLSDPDLLKRFQAEAKPLAKERLRLFQRCVARKIRITPFDMKQYFLRQGDMENHGKAEQLASDYPGAGIRQIKDELDYFGQAFLAGFLDFYHQRLTKEVEGYERVLHLLEERNLSGEAAAFYLVKATKGALDIVISGFSDLEEARESLLHFYEE